jgi:hypothetical protein
MNTLISKPPFSVKSITTCVWTWLQAIAWLFWVRLLTYPVRILRHLTDLNAGHIQSLQLITMTISLTKVNFLATYIRTIRVTDLFQWLKSIKQQSYKLINSQSSKNKKVTVLMFVGTPPTSAIYILKFNGSCFVHTICIIFKIYFQVSNLNIPILLHYHFYSNFFKRQSRTLLIFQECMKSLIFQSDRLTQKQTLKNFPYKNTTLPLLLKNKWVQH